MTSALNILMFSESTYPRHPGGAGKCSHQLAAGLVARGHSVYLVSYTPDEAIRETIDGVQVHRISRVDESNLAKEEVESTIATHILDYLESETPLSSMDIVHDSGGFLSYFFPVEWALKEKWHLPLVLHYRYLMMRHRIMETSTGQLNLLGREFLGFESLLHITSQGFPARFADRVIVLSAEERDFVAQHYRPSAPMEIMPSPVVMHDVPLDRRRARRQSLAGNDETPLVLFGGRITDQRFKGTDIVRDAFGRLLKLRPGCRLVLAGIDVSVQASFRKAFGNALIEPGWNESASDFAEVLAAVDVVWVPSRYEPFGLMCAEAMAVGTAVIASPVGGLRDMIADEQTGLLLSERKQASWPEELASRTARLLSEPETRRAMGARARVFAEKNLSVAAVCERTEALYRAAIEAVRPAGKPLVSRPAWSAADTEAYLDRLASMAGGQARVHGLETLANWQATATDRCKGCTHAYMASSIRNLKRYEKSWLPRVLRSAGWHEQFARDVTAVCPFALRQKELASQPSGASRLPS